MGYSSICFIDSRWPDLNQNLVWPVIGNDLASLPAASSVFVAIGDNVRRLEVARLLMARGHHLPILIHDTAFVSQHAALGAGTVVMPQAAINAGAHLGMGVIINTGASVDHDCQLADAVHVSPGARLAGTVTVGEASWVGIGASVREGLQIGAGVMIGAGAAVVTSVKDGARMLGVPAREVG